MTANYAPYSVPGRVDPVLLADRTLKILLRDEEYYVTNGIYRPIELTAHMWTTVTEWMMEVCEVENRHAAVCALAINCFNRFITQRYIKKDRLQLLAIACLLVASKFRETTPLMAEDLIYYTNNAYTKTQLLDMEVCLLRKLQWMLCAVLQHEFIPHLLHHIDPSYQCHCTNRKWSCIIQI